MSGKKKGKKAPAEPVEWVAPEQKERGDEAVRKEAAKSEEGTANEDLLEESTRNDAKYVKNDRVQYKGVNYTCRKSHWQEDSKPPDEDIHLWREA